jgi:hypothetical protein
LDVIVWRSRVTFDFEVVPLTRIVLEDEIPVNRWDEFQVKMAVLVCGVLVIDLGYIRLKIL